MHPIGYITRCWKCGEKLVAVDDYGDYNKMIWRDGHQVRKTEDRWFDPDWVLLRHLRKSHEA